MLSNKKEKLQLLSIDDGSKDDTWHWMQEAKRILGDQVTIMQQPKNMGKRHVAYGVQDKDYDSVGAALLWTLGKGLGEDFTPETEAAWAKTYGILSTTMKDAAAEGDTVGEPATA